MTHALKQMTTSSRIEGHLQPTIGNLRWLVAPSLFDSAIRAIRFMEWRAGR
jgi:hypothetical protein